VVKHRRLIEALRL